MIIKESIKANVSLKAHPLGLKQHLKNKFAQIKDNQNIAGAKNVLILGGSSGYGLVTRIVASEKMQANTVSISFEKGPENNRTGTAGFWNLKYYNELTATTALDYNIDAFDPNEQKQVVADLQTMNIQFDLVVFSLAAGKKMVNGEVISSTLKPIGQTITGKTIDIAKNVIKEIEIEPATETEIANTIAVMGGSDWYSWISALAANDLLLPNCKTISYTYIGDEPTKAIYGDGTIGMAKKDLEVTAIKLNADFDVEASIVSAKAIATKASVFIPSMPIYAGCLYEVMTNEGVQESDIAHIYRLFNDMIYGNKAIIDEQGRIRIDHLEVDKAIQEQTLALMNTLSDEELLSLGGVKTFINDFYNLNGFRVSGVDYEADVDLEKV